MLAKLRQAATFVGWLFFSFELRFVVALEVFLFLDLPFTSHVGFVRGDHPAMLMAPYLGFLFGVPALNALMATVLAHAFTAGEMSSERYHALWIFVIASIAVNAAALIGLSGLWPATIHVELPYAVVLAAIQTLGSFFSRWLLQNSVVGKLPTAPKAS